MEVPPDDETNPPSSWSSRNRGNDRRLPSSANKNTSSIAAPVIARTASRNLDRGLNRSLSHLDSRYVDNNKLNDNSGSENFIPDSYHANHQRRDSSIRSSTAYGRNNSIRNNSIRNIDRSLNGSSIMSIGNDDIYAHSSAHFSRTDPREISWQEDEGEIAFNYDEGDSYYENNNDASDDPRSFLFRLLDLYCSAHVGGEQGNDRSRPLCNDWEPIREWLLSNMPPGEDDSLEPDPHRDSKDHLLRLAVIEARGESGETILHLACERSVPLDILELLLSVKADNNSKDAEDGTSLAQYATIDGWLPLHYACNYPNDYAVVKRLVEAFPEAKTHSDLKGRTPLHFAMREENMNRSEVVALLACASGIADDNGILPLHYACLYGASEDFLRILTEAYPGGVVARDRFGRVPLHYSLSNAGKPNAPAAVRLLLSLAPDLVNTPGIARVFSESDAVRKYAKEYEHKRVTNGGSASAPTKEVFSDEAVEECLKRLLEAKPNPKADFFTALQSLPEPLRDKAVLMRVVQELLNKKIGQRFPTALLLLDLYLQMVVMVCYTLTIRDAIRMRFGDNDDAVINSGIWERSTQQWFSLIGLYLALLYFLCREIVQIIGLVSLKASWIWIYEPGNWLNVTYIATIGTWTILATNGKGDDDIFRNGSALSFAFLWLKFLSYLRKILIDFSVFSGGVFHVLRRLLAFLICLTIILIAFSRMFFALFYETEQCTAFNDGLETATMSSNFTDSDAWEIPAFFAQSTPLNDDEEFTKNLICEANNAHIPWCTTWDSFLAVYTMLLGEVDETVFADNTTATILFVVFMLLVVILLANVLIAIVTDSYKVIRDKRAAIVFWTNRLDFIAQMDAIANGPWKARLKGLLGLPNSSDGSSDMSASNGYSEAAFGKALWNDILELFEHESLVEDGILSLDFVLCMILRFFAVLMVPFWILVGAISAGLLWPPQIRERLFISAVTKHSSKSEQEETLRKTQIENLKGEIAQLKHDLVMESSQHRTQIVQMKSAVAERKLETLNTLTMIKKNMVLALELCEIGNEEG